MADHNVTLTYVANAGATAVVADPFTIVVRPGPTIGFTLGAGSLAGTIRVTFRDRRFFHGHQSHFRNDGVVHQGDGDITVAMPLTGPTTYHCELLDGQGNVRAQSNEPAGGEILPDSLAGVA